MELKALGYRFPLRLDFLAQLVVPRDLTVEEAQRMEAFLLTIVVPPTECDGGEERR